MPKERILRVVRVFSGSGEYPIEGASVSFRLRDHHSPPAESVTDVSGMASVLVPTHFLDGGDSIDLIVMALDHDPGLIQQLDPESREFTFHLRRYPPATRNLGWWHRLLGISRYQDSRGAGVRIGVIDSGIAEHPDLRHVIDCGTFSNAGRIAGSDGRDEMNHGTGVVALLAARPASLADYGGVAPGASLLSARAFSHVAVGSSMGTQGEIQEALHYLYAQGVDLVNCSFSSEVSSLSLEDVIEDGYNRGVLCVCAAGNKPDYVGFPARSRLAVAVAAIGLKSQLQAFGPDEKSELWKGDFFVPTFSARGEKITCCGPGVGMITAASAAAIVPSHTGRRASCRVFGTSFACPLVCGILAAILSEDSDYLAMPRNSARADYALNKLISCCRTLGFPPSCEGAGLPQLASGHAK